MVIRPRLCRPACRRLGPHFSPTCRDLPLPASRGLGLRFAYDVGYDDVVVLPVGWNSHVSGTGRRWGSRCNVATAAKHAQQSCQSETEHRHCERKDDEEPGPLHESILTGRSTRRIPSSPVRGHSRAALSMRLSCLETPTRLCQMDDRSSTRYVETSDGISLAYKITGEGPQDLVWIAGLGYPPTWWPTSRASCTSTDDLAGSVERFGMSPGGLEHLGVFSPRIRPSCW